MSFWEAVGLVSAMTTILGVFLAIYGLINNRTLKGEARGIRRTLEEEAKGIREILVRIEQGQTEARREMAEAIKAIQQGQSEARKEMAEAIKYVADLIRQEGGRTREAIQARP